MSSQFTLKLSSITPAFVEASRKDKLSPHFSLWEMANTWRTGRTEAANFLYAHYYRASLTKLCVELLQPMRDYFQRPIMINSAMRWAEQNTLTLDQSTNWWEGIDVDIRSVYAKKKYKPRSQHTRGEGADVRVSGVPVRELWDWAREECPNPFGQAIYEVGARSAWLHISIPGIRTTNGKLIYGEVLDAKIDAMQRARYSRFETFQGRKDRWNKQGFEDALSKSRVYRNDLTRVNP